MRKYKPLYDLIQRLVLNVSNHTKRFDCLYKVVARVLNGMEDIESQDEFGLELR